MSPDPAPSRATLTIDLDAIADNYRRLADRAAPATCSAVIKADAYGLGAAAVGPCLRDAGARLFFVAHLTEAIALRRHLPDADIAVFNGPMAGEVGDYRAYGLIAVLNHPGQIELWRSAASDGPVPAFIHIDTGMNRLGLGPAECQRLIDDPSVLTGIPLRGWLSHLACADDPAHPLNEQQRTAFRDALRALPPAPASLANSSGIFLGPDYHLDFARPGCALYGVNPRPHRPNPMRPVVRLTAPIIQVRCVDSPATVGYGATHKIALNQKIATVPVGYADGYMRFLSNRGRMRVAGRIVPVVGRVSMDLVTIDVTGCPDADLEPGAEVEVLGPHMTVDDVAADAGTIGYEILTALGQRYHRRYAPLGAAA